MRERRRKDRIEAMASELAAELDSLLEGRYTDYLRDTKQPVPTWAWVNVLAHGTEAELADLASGADGARSELTDWDRAVAFLAEDILAYSRASGVAVATLQRSRLVPLELDLIDSVDSADDRAVHPGRLAAIVMAAVHRHPSSPRRCT